MHPRSKRITEHLILLIRQIPPCHLFNMHTPANIPKLNHLGLPLLILINTGIPINRDRRDKHQPANKGQDKSTPKSGRILCVPEQRPTDGTDGVPDEVERVHNGLFCVSAGVGGVEAEGYGEDVGDYGALRGVLVSS